MFLKTASFDISYYAMLCYTTWCVDLNPASYACMVSNARGNNCPTHLLKCYNEDGRDFLLTLLQTRGGRVDHVLMNLPQSATDFLDVFIGYNSKRKAAVDEAAVSRCGCSG
jgi:tRNA G37 N-methylase Trm5